MALSEGNLFVDGFRGKAGGNIVFRKHKSGKLIIPKNRKKSTKPPTEQQLKIRDTFKEAVICAKAVMQNALNSVYGKAVQSIKVHTTIASHRLATGKSH
jgi:hypothetical protein